jgi:excisionase family DNA binding protein
VITSDCVWALSFQAKRLEEEVEMDAKRESSLPIRLLLTPDEAALALGISRAKLYPMLMRGEIPSIRFGGSRRVPIAALRRFIEKQLADDGSHGELSADMHLES